MSKERGLFAVATFSARPVGHGGTRDGVATAGSQSGNGSVCRVIPRSIHGGPSAIPGVGQDWAKAEASSPRSAAHRPTTFEGSLPVHNKRQLRQELQRSTELGQFIDDTFDADSRCRSGPAKTLPCGVWSEFSELGESHRTKSAIRGLFTTPNRFLRWPLTIVPVAQGSIRLTGQMAGATVRRLFRFDASRLVRLARLGDQKHL